MDLTQREQELLVINSFRYSLGRMTYIVYETINFLRNHWDEFNSHTQRVIQNDLKLEIDTYNRLLENKDSTSPTNLGMKMDAESWIEFYNWSKLHCK